MHGGTDGREFFLPILSTCRTWKPIKLNLTQPKSGPADSSQEYLSKPLKPTQLIQTILKCATLGGVLLEGSNDKREVATDISITMDALDEIVEMHGHQHAQRLEEVSSKRPHLEVRAFTAAPGNVSPSILSADAGDPIERVSSPFSDFWILRFGCTI